VREITSLLPHLGQQFFCIGCAMPEKKQFECQRTSPQRTAKINDLNFY